MSTSKTTKKDDKPVVKRPFNRGRRNIDELLGEDTSDSGPSDLGNAFTAAVRVKKPTSLQAFDKPIAPTIDEGPPGPKMTYSTPKPSDEISDFVLMSLSKIVENVDIQPRLRIDEDRVAELATFFRQESQIYPILVRPVDNTQGTEYEIIGGNHRFRAAKSLGWEKIGCRILNVTQSEARFLAVRDNEGVLEPTQYEMALSYKKLLDSGDVPSQAALADRLSKSRAHISQLKSFTELPSGVRDILNEHPGLFTYRTAADLNKIIADADSKELLSKNEIETILVQGVQKMVGGSKPAGAVQWIRQSIAGTVPFKPAVKPRYVIGADSREAFTTKGRGNSVVIQWDKDAPYSAELIQDAVIETLRTMIDDDKLKLDPDTVE